MLLCWIIFCFQCSGGDVIHKITSAFYHKVFADSHLSKFVQDESVPHSTRLGNWFIEKMGGEGKPWTSERVERRRCPVHVTLGDGSPYEVHDRSSAHMAAWFSPRRHPAEMGERFKLHDARNWMRLIFWSARETGIFLKSPSFEDWFVRFIAHFMNVYERSAPPFAVEDCAWSSQRENIERYVDEGNHMSDVLYTYRKPTDLL